MKSVRTEIIPIYIVSIFDYIIFDKLAARYLWQNEFWITGHYSLWTEPLRMTPAFARKQRVRLGSVIVHLHCQLHWFKIAMETCLRQVYDGVSQKLLYEEARPMLMWVA